MEGPLHRWHGGAHAEEQPRRPRRALECPAPQARDPRLDRSSSSSPPWSAAPSGSACWPTRTWATASRAPPTRRSPPPASRRSPASRCSCRRAGGEIASHDARFTAAVGDVVKQLKAAPHVREVESPYAKGNEGQLSRDGTLRARDLQAPGRGRRRQGPRRRDARRHRRRPARAPRPADRAVRRRQRGQGAVGRRSTRTSRRPSSSRCRSRC